MCEKLSEVGLSEDPYCASLASQTLYLTIGGRKGSGVRLYNVSCPSPGIVGKRTSTVLLMLADVLEITAGRYYLAAYSWRLHSTSVNGSLLFSSSCG